MTSMRRLEQELEKLELERQKLRGPGSEQTYTSNTVSSSNIYNTQPKKYAPVTAPKPRRNPDGTLPPAGSRGLPPSAVPKPYKGPLYPPPPPAKTSQRHEQLRSRPAGPGLSSYAPVAYAVPDEDLPPPPPPPANYQGGSQIDDLPPPPPPEPNYGYAPPPQNAPYNERHPRAHVGQIPHSTPEPQTSREPGRPPSQTQQYGPRRPPGSQVPRPQEPPPGSQKAKSSEWAYFLPQPSDQPVSNPDRAGPEAKVDHLTNLLVQNMDSRPDEGEYFGLCTQCGLKVVGEDSGCTAMDRVFHVACFTCATCHTKLRGQPFYAMESKAFCESCYIASLEKCATCSKPITERILRATGKPYHPACFTCVVCGESLDGVPFTVDATNQIHCIKDFHKKFAPRCSVCLQPIMPEQGQEETVRIVALDRSFHVGCYRCEDCGLQLSSEVDGQGCYPLDDHVLCRECNAKRVQSLTAM